MARSRTALSDRNRGCEPPVPSEVGDPPRGKTHCAEAPSCVREFFAAAAFTVAMQAGAVVLPWRSPENTLVGGTLAVAAAGWLAVSMTCRPGHFGCSGNPAVTVALLAVRQVTLRNTVATTLCQFAGGLLAAAAVRYFVPSDVLYLHRGGAPTPLASLDWPQVLLGELLAGVVFGWVALTIDRPRLPRPDRHATAVACFLVVASLTLRPLTGGLTQPAAALAPMLVGGFRDHWWAYVVGPMLGVSFAAVWQWAFPTSTGQTSSGRS